MPKNYLLFASLSYAYSILRPLEKEIKRRGDNVAWYLEKECPDMLLPNEIRLTTFEDVKCFNPIAVFAPGNWIYDFFPGVKVEVFHGYPMKKRIEKIDDHFNIRGWFDIYCTQGPSSTPYFKKLEKKHGFFKIYETGWCKVDEFFADKDLEVSKRDKPTILYAPTFTRGISSAWDILDEIENMAQTKSWNWIITFHPKLNDEKLIADYKAMADRYPNVDFRLRNKGLETFKETDALLCDSSSIIVEYELLNKPVVTFRNTHPDKHLLNVQNKEKIAAAIELALTKPDDLMNEIHLYTAQHEAHRDGGNSARVLDAVDDFIVNFQGKIKPKPFNLFRKLKLRKKLGFYHWNL